MYLDRVEKRNLCVPIDVHNSYGIGKLHFCKQCGSCKNYKQPKAIHYARDIDGHVDVTH